jgi:hypothetical protein
MRILIACEFSGVVRRAFQARGFETWSCDLLPAEDGETLWHIQDSVQHVFAQRGWWDLVIAHPPCTRLCNSGVRWLHERNLWEDLEEAADLFRCCLNAPADAVAVENPVMHKHALALIGERPAFSVQPWQFGDPAKKRTCFWTRDLPPLRPTSDMTAADAKPECHYASPGPDRWKQRSRTYPGLAESMADQWGDYIAERAAA